MKKQQANRPLLAEEIDQLDFGDNQQEVRELFEQEGLPSPSQLERYDQLMPNGAERILNIIEDEKIRRYDIELKQVKGRNRLNQLISASGLVLGIFLFLTIITTPIGLSHTGFLLICAIIVLILIIAPLYRDKIRR